MGLREKCVGQPTHRLNLRMFKARTFAQVLHRIGQNVSTDEARSVWMVYKLGFGTRWEESSHTTYLYGVGGI